MELEVVEEEELATSSECSSECPSVDDEEISDNESFFPDPYCASKGKLVNKAAHAE